MKTNIPIFYACDDAFVKYTIVSIQSIIEHSSAENHYDIYILNTDISDDMKGHLSKLKRENVSITFIDVTEHLNAIIPELPIRDYYSTTTYFRLFIAEMFPHFDKAIYIDSDTVVLRDIAGLYNHDVTNYFVGAVHEQAMIQVDEFGTYVEEVAGISRHEYFNAGILLINCEAFRAHSVLKQFIKLLHEYNFIVVQDQDYLNVICHQKVLWVDQGWNTEVFGELPVAEKDIKIIHYIMVSKPWHYADCRLKEYFWHYAKKTSVYDLILKTLADYTDESRQKDQESVVRLVEMAVNETARNDSYYKVKKKLNFSQMIEN